MKRVLLRASAILLVLSLTVQADDFTISWLPPTQYTDGTPLLEQELDFYTLYINGTGVVNLDVILGTWTANVTITEPGTHVLALTVTANNGVESNLSDTVNFTVGPRTPMAPVSLTILP
jgi:hypothetical protein